MAYIYVLLTIIIADALWLLVITKNFYKSQLGHLFADKVSYWPIIIFYPLFAFGLYYFVVKTSSGVSEVIVKGLIFGVICYVTYDLTNQATMKDWPYIVTVVDILWGGFIGMAASLASYYLSKML
jgi:uncharacterized membrane protein